MAACGAKRSLAAVGTRDQAVVLLRPWGLGMLRRGSSYTGTRMHMNGFCGQRFTAFRADHYGIEHLLAALVFVQQRPSARVDHVDVAPVHDRHDDRIKVEALLRQNIFVALWRFLIGDPA